MADAQYAQRLVKIHFELSADTLSLRIQDEGAGFPHAQSIQAHVSPELLKCSGRGLAIIDGAVDHVSFNAQGNEIRMKKKIAAAPVRKKCDGGPHGA